jgi:hypothetical protein
MALDNATPVLDERVLGSDPGQVGTRALDPSDELVDVSHVLLAASGLGQHGAVEGDVRCERQRFAGPLADSGIRVRRGRFPVVEQPRRQRHDIGQGAQHRVAEAGDDSPGAQQDGDVSDQAAGLVREDGHPADLAIIDDARPEQEDPVRVGHLVRVSEVPDDAGGLTEEPEREVLAVQVLGEDRGMEGHALPEKGRDLRRVAAFGGAGETMGHHDLSPVPIPVGRGRSSAVLAWRCRRSGGTRFPAAC